MYRFDFEVRIKALKIGPIRLYGREPEPKQCLIVSTHDDYTFVFFEFKFEVNTQHISFKKAMIALVEQRDQPTQINFSSTL